MIHYIIVDLLNSNLYRISCLVIFVVYDLINELNSKHILDVTELLFRHRTPASFLKIKLFY